MMYEIRNVVASTRILGNFDIELLVNILNNVQYEPERFSGLVYRKKYTIIMFYSGKISSQGLKSEKDAKRAIVETISEIKSHNGIIGSDEMEKITIENIVATYDLKTEIDLVSLYEILEHVIYEPEQFPGLMYRPFNNSVVCLIFSSGKTVIVGSKNGDILNQALNKMKEKIRSAFPSSLTYPI